MKPPKVFISYSWKDRNIAEAIHLQLAIEGFEVWRDQTGVASNWSREIAVALAEADILCLLWSDYSARSNWVKHEWLTARALGKTIIPCLLPNAPKLPQAICNILGISFIDDNECIKQLTEKLRNVQQYSTKYDYTILPEKSYIPFNPNPHFIGRDTELLDLYLDIIGNQNKIGVNLVGITGMGGIGKTQLIIEFAYRFSFAFESVHWVQAANPDLWTQAFVSLARDELKLQIQSPQSPDANDQYITELRNYCRMHPQILIIMDNVEDPIQLHNDTCLSHNITLTPLTLGCNLLFTTRRHFTIPGVIPQEIRILQEKSSYSLLTQGRQPTNNNEKTQASKICNAVGYLPLAIVLIAGYLNKYHSVSFSDYHEELIKNKLDTIDIGEISSEQLATRHEAAIGVTLNSQWSMLEDEWAKNLFQIAGMFPETALIPKARLALFVQVSSNISGKLTNPIEKAFFLLHELCLVEVVGRNHNTIRLHPLIRDFINKRLISGEAQSNFKHAAALNMSANYRQPSRLEKEYLSRSIDQIIGDLKMAIQWFNQNMEEKIKVDKLKRVLERERHYLNVLPLSKIIDDLDELVSSFSENDPVNEVIQQLKNSVTLKRDQFKSMVSDRVYNHAWDSLFNDLKMVIKVLLKSPTIISLKKQFKAESDYLRELLNVEFSETQSPSQSIIRQLSAAPFVYKGSFDKKVSLPSILQQVHIRAFNMGWDGLASIYCEEFSTRSEIFLKSIVVSELEDPALIRTFNGGQFNWITALSISEDTHFALSGGNFGGIEYWNLETGDSLIRFKVGTSSAIESISLASNGEKALIGCKDGTIIYFSLKENKPLLSFKGHSGKVNCVSLSSNGRLAVSCSDDGLVNLWHLDTGAPPECFYSPLASDQILSVQLINGESQIVCGTSNGKIITWDRRTGRVLNNISFFNDVYYGSTMAITASGKQMLCASILGSLCLVDIQTGKIIHKLNNNNVRVESISISSDERLALTGLADGLLILWDLTEGKIVRTYKGHSNIIHSNCFSPDGAFALSGSSDGIIIMWDLNLKEDGDFKFASSPQAPTTKNAPSKSVKSKQRSNSRSTFGIDSSISALNEEIKRIQELSEKLSKIDHSDSLAALYDSLEVYQDDAEMPSLELSSYEDKSKKITAVAIDSDGLKALSINGNGELNLWDIKKRKRLKTITKAMPRTEVLGISFCSSSDLAFMYSNTGLIRSWDLTSGNRVHSFSIEDLSYMSRAACFSKDGRRILYGAKNGTIELLDIESKKVLHAFQSHTENIHSLAMSDNERRAVSSSFNSENVEVIFWDLQRGQVINTLRGTENYATLVTIKADGKYAATVGAFNTIKVWDVDLQVILFEFSGHIGEVTEVFFCSDNKHLISCSKDRSIIVWDLDEGKSVKRIFVKNPVTCLAEAEKRLIIGDKGGIIQIFEMVSNLASNDR